VKVYLPQTIATPLTVIQRERVLPVAGEILVREGERVEPIQVIGQANLPMDRRVVNVARVLGLSPAAVGKALKVKSGQKVKRGQVLAAVRWPNKRVCRAPIDGVVTDGGGGWLLIEAPPQEFELRANLYGTISRVVAGWGVVIRTHGALIQGAWGNGKEGSGVLKVLIKERDKPLRGRSIDATCRGTVLIGGGWLDKDALEKAVEMQVRGIITGGLSPDALTAAEEMAFPIVVTEALGDAPMCPRIHHLLMAHDGREATLDARFRTGWEVVRPEVIVPLPAEGAAEALPDANLELKVGDVVRGVRAPYLGITGVVVAFPSWARTASGAQMAAARVKRDDDEQIMTIPLVNLEILR
jgi:hypothetical protein